MVDVKKIKLVVWDLDDTFWNGTISEGEAQPIAENIQLVHDLTDCGIINSICSKNDAEETKQYLQQLNVWDEFVFASINWDGKGQRLQKMIDGMALRPVNVLFLDDNKSNLGEAQHFMPDIQVAGPEEIPNLIEQVAQLEKKDPKHKRLKQYKVLEQKAEEAKSYGNSEDFLFASQIEVTMHKDCIQQLERLHELLMRSNQLNYTKKRISIDELRAIVEDHNYTCGYVSVVDRFGDYGIVGFYAVHNGEAEHFLFSCRTMGQKIEQWVYAQLGFPKLTVVGEVRTQLNSTECPAWINQTCTTNKENKQQPAEKVENIKVLLKGPCDLSHAEMYIRIAKQFDAEYTYVTDDGRTIDAYNHSAHILGQALYTNEDKQLILAECPFVDEKALNSQFFTGQYDVIFLSTLIEAMRGIYHRSGSQIRVAYYTDTPDAFNAPEGTWVYDGLTTPSMYTDFLAQCLEKLSPQTTLCLILGPTQKYEKDQALQHFYHELNVAIVAFAKDHPQIRYISIDDCIVDSSDFTDALTHFSSRVYYEIAQRMITVIKDSTGIAYNWHTWLGWHVMLSTMRKHLKAIVPEKSRLYALLQKVYKKLAHKR